MDNLTHSLAGAVLGQMGLKRKTGLAMPTLIIAANLPDIDAWTTVWGIESLAMRRGLTHGPIALLVLPLLLWAAMIWLKKILRNQSSTIPARKKLNWLQPFGLSTPSLGSIIAVRRFHGLRLEREVRARSI